MTKTQELVLTMMAAIMSRDDAYQVANDHLKDLDTDFPVRITFIDDHLWRPLMDLLDGAAGDSTPSYFLDEARHMKDGGCTTEADGTRWPFKTLDDVRSYLDHINSIPTP